MVPLHASTLLVYVQRLLGDGQPHTELLLDDLEDLLLVELLWQTLDGSQSLATIALWANVSTYP